MTIKKGTFKASVYNAVSDEMSIYSDNSVKAKLTISGGSFTKSVCNYNPATLSIKGGTFKDYLYNHGTLTIKKGTFKNTIENGSVLSDNPTGTMTINGGTFYTIRNQVSITINNGVFKGGGYIDGAIANQGGSITINNGTFSAQVLNDGNAELVIKGGTFSSEDEPIWNCDSTLTIKGGTFTYTGTQGSYAVMAGNLWDEGDTGKVTISGGTFSASTKGGGLRVNGGTVIVSGGSFYGKGASNDNPLLSGSGSDKYGGIDVYTTKSALTITNVSSTTTVNYYGSN